MIVIAAATDVTTNVPCATLYIDWTAWRKTSSATWTAHSIAAVPTVLNVKIESTIKSTSFVMLHTI